MGRPAASGKPLKYEAFARRANALARSWNDSGVGKHRADIVAAFTELCAGNEANLDRWYADKSAIRFRDRRDFEDFALT